MAAMKACEKENGITFDHKAGKHPTDEQKAVIEKCLVGKGFEKPPGHEHGHDHGHGKGAPPPPKSPEIPPADPAAAK